MPTKTNQRKKSVLQLHNDKECGCTIIQEKNNCIYQSFPDGWEFTPDVGNGQSRGEVFTPRFIVDKMIHDVGMFPEEAIYNNNYSTLTKEEKLEKIESKIIEPAVGTANYTSTVIWHKINYAYHAAKTDNGLNIEEYNKLFIKSFSNIYAFDIDAGNLETTTRRLLNYNINDKINDTKTVNKWVNKTIKAFSKNNKNVDKKLLKNSIKNSLTLADDNWGKFLYGKKGIAEKLYEQHTGTQINDIIKEKCLTILEDNIKLFNGIVKDDVIDENVFIPGWFNVKWVWWNVNDDLSLNKKYVWLRQQMLEGEIEQLERKAETIKKDKMIEKSDGLFSTLDWIDNDAKKEYNNILKQIDKTKKEYSK